MLSEVRKLLGFTQKDLSNLVGVTQNYYAVIESNPTKSAPLMQKLSDELKIGAKFLAVGDRSRYPFHGNFYTFYIDPFKPFSGYDFLNTNICIESSFIDLAIFLDTSENWRIYPLPICFAMRDEHDTFFLVTSKMKPRFGIGGRSRPEMKNPAASSGELNPKILLKKGAREELAEVKYFVPKIDLFRKNLYKNDRLLVYENTVIAPDSLYSNLTKGKVSRKDIAEFFPDRNYFKRLYEAHKSIEK